MKRYALLIMSLSLLLPLSGCSKRKRPKHVHHAILFAQQTLDGRIGFCKAAWKSPGKYVTGYPHRENPSPYGTGDTIVTPPGKGGWFYVLEGYTHPDEGPRAGTDVHLQAWVAVRWESTIQYPRFRYELLAIDGTITEHPQYNGTGILIDTDPAWRPTQLYIDRYRERTP